MEKNIRKVKWIYIFAAVTLIVAFGVVYLYTLEKYRWLINTELKSQFDNEAASVFDDMQNKTKAGMIDEVIESHNTDFFITNLYSYTTGELIINSSEYGNYEVNKYISQVAGRIFPYSSNEFNEAIYGKIHGDYFLKGQRIIVDNKAYFLISAMYTNPFKYYSFGEMLLYGGMVIYMAVAFAIIIVVHYMYKVSKKKIEDKAVMEKVFIAVAHDVRSPITAIVGYIDNLSQMVKTDKEKYYIEAVNNNVSYINNMADTLMDYVRTGKILKINKETVNIRDIIDELSHRYSEALDKNALDIMVEGNCEIKTDYTLMQHMLDNLIANAIKYAAHGSVIEIVLKNDKIIISNIMRESVSCPPYELWEPLKKGNAARTGRTGSGLGLSIVKNIMDVLGYSGDILINDGEFLVEVGV